MFKKDKKTEEEIQAEIISEQEQRLNEYYHYLVELAGDSAEAAYIAIEGIGKLEPVIQRRITGGEYNQEVDWHIINTFSSEMSMQLALMARKIAEEPGYERMPWEYDARIIITVLYEIGAAYTLWSLAETVDDLLAIPEVSTETLKRLTNKEVRAWLKLHTGLV